MYIERNAGGQIAAAFLDEQFRGQEWLPIDSRVLQQFLATVASAPHHSCGIQPPSALPVVTPG